MKVLLLYPNFYGMNMLPPAIGFFTALLKNDGHQVFLFDTTTYEGSFGGRDSDKQKSEDLNARPFDDSLLHELSRKSDPIQDFVEYVSLIEPDLIAMSATEDMYPIGITLLKALHEGNRPKVVIGGVFATFAPELALRYAEGAIDWVLKGEGDVTLPELCRRLENGLDIDDLPGLYALKGEKVINNALPVPVDMGTLPLPDYSLFDESRYYRPMQGKLWRMLPVQTIRGCPYTCAYCNSPSQMKIHNDEDLKFFRKQHTEIIYDELKHCRDVYKADSFYFWADTFLAWSDREFDEFCSVYKEFSLPFWIQTRPETVKRDRFKRLKDIGLLRVAFGVEHGNERFREKILHRRVKNSLIIDNLKIVTDLNIPISVNNIIGLPTETRELVFDTIELNRHFKSDGINAYSFVPFHGTPLRELSEALGYVEKGTLTRSITAPTILTMPQFTKEAIEGVRRCFVLYVKMPRSRWADIKKAEQLTDEGDRIFKALKDECRDRYMNYGDYVVEDDIEKIDFEKDETIRKSGHTTRTGEIDFEKILRSHSRTGEVAIQLVRKST